MDAATAIVEKIVVVLTDSDRPETKENRHYSKTMIKQFDTLGLHVEMLRESELSDETLRERKLVVLPCNASLRFEAEQAIIRFINRGGKVFIAYHMSRSLGHAIGIEPSLYQRENRPGQFAEIRFDEEFTKKIEGLPSSVRQASWNLNTARPITGKSKIWGAWFDDKENPTGQAALIVSDQGAFLTHVILEDDNCEAKRQFLAALIGKLYPDLWRQMARFEIEKAASVGSFHAPEKIAKMIERSKTVRAVELAKQTRNDFAKVYELFKSQKYVKTIRAARNAHRRLSEAYLGSVSSRDVEGRAIWNHSGTGAYPGDWDRTMRELSEAGFNMVLPNMLWGGVAHYPSDVLPRSKTFERYGDQIAACVKAGNKYGIEVHVWKVNWVLGGAPDDFVEKLRSEGRLQKICQGT